jgi:hypothetical protein
VLAVEVHQVNSGSSDIVWGTALNGIVSFAPVFTNAALPANTNVLQNRPLTLGAQVDGFPSPTVQWFFEGAGDPNFIAIADATNRTLTLPRMALTNAGSYFCEASNSLGVATSRVAIVTYRADTNAAHLLFAAGSASFNRVVLQFDEAMAPGPVSDTANFEVSDGVNILSVASTSLSPDGAGVILITDGQTEDTLYTVTTSFLTDLAANPVAAPASATFRSWTTKGCNGLTFEAYNVGPGTAINILTNSPLFPNSPRERLLMTSFDSREAYADDAHENFGARISGYFIPDISGPWVFHMRSDDAGELWLNPNGPTRSGRQLIAYELGCCNAYQAQGASQTSVPIPLLAGQAYYIEGLYKENTGGDYYRVVARLDGQPVPPTAGNNVPDPEVIPSSLIGHPAFPSDALGGIQVSQQPSGRTVEEHTPSVSFSVTAVNTNEAVICYQWQRSDSGGAFADIPSANSRSYSISFPTVANDEGDRYRVVMQIHGACVISAEAPLHITPDMSRPAVACALATSPTALVVYFTEPMAAAGAIAGNYTMDQSINVMAAAVSGSNPLRVDLTLDAGTPMTVGTVYHLTVNGVADPSGNLVNPNPTIVSIRAQNYPDNPDGLPTLPTDEMLPLGSLTDRGFNARIVQVGVAIGNDNGIAEQMLGGTFINFGTGLPYPNIAPAGAQSFVEPGVINYNRDLPAGASLGRLQPDVQFPGYPPAPSGASYENMAMEALTFLALRAGIHRHGVNSDDGFRVSSALSVTDPNNVLTLGEFNGGRGSADTTFDFIVKQDGLYPFRLIWEQGQGGANVEWWSVDLDNAGATLAINDNSGIQAFTLPPPPVLRIDRDGTNVVLSWTLGSDPRLQAQFSSDLAVWQDDSRTPAIVAGRYVLTYSASEAHQFFRLAEGLSAAELAGLEADYCAAFPDACAPPQPPPREAGHLRRDKCDDKYETIPPNKNIHAESVQVTVVPQPVKLANDTELEPCDGMLKITYKDETTEEKGPIGRTKPPFHFKSAKAVEKLELKCLQHDTQVCNLRWVIIYTPCP